MARGTTGSSSSLGDEHNDDIYQYNEKWKTDLITKGLNPLEQWNDKKTTQVVSLMVSIFANFEKF